MNEMNEKLAGELIDAIQTATEKCTLLAIMTGDQEFQLLRDMIVTMLTAKAKGDLEAVAAAIIPVLSAAMNPTNAVEDLTRRVNAN